MHAIIVIPCYDEAKRFDPHVLARLMRDERVSVLAVDDGSRDDTRAVLTEIARDYPGRMDVLALPQNGGKAEAVRAGMRRALADGAAVVGYTDADFATPPEELARLMDELEKSEAEIVIGSRVQRLGADIDRSPVRHVIGRVFATAAGLAVGSPVYDTQCGAKLFRATPALHAALAEAFSSRWSFDVELLARLFGRLPSEVHTDPSRALEVPLMTWRDVAGSKLSLKSMAKSFAELLQIWARAERFERTLKKR